MATPNIVPRADSEGGIGTASKYWASAYIDLIYVGAGKIGRDADNLLDFTADNHLTLRLNANNKLVFDGARMYPNSNDGYGLGLASNSFSDLFLASGAVINFDGGEVTMTHSGSGDFTIDAADDIRFDAGGGDVVLRAGGTEYGRLSNSSGDFVIKNITADKDVIFQADNGSGGVANYFKLSGVTSKTIFSKTLNLQDSVSLYLGTGNDLQLVHNSTNSEIVNATGDLYIKQTVDDGDIIFQSDDGSGGITTYITIDGSVAKTEFAKHTSHKDNITAYFGDGLDLQIFHNGSNSNIQQAGTGNLIIRNITDDTDIIFQNDDGAGGFTTYFYLDGSSASHDGSATTALYTNWPDKSRISVGTSHDLQISHDGANSYVENITNDLLFINYADGGDIVFKSDDGSGGTTEYLTLDGGDVNIKVRQHMVFNDSKAAYFGSGADLSIYHDGSNSYISDTGTGTLYVKTNSFRVRNSGGSEDIIKALEDGAVTLYHDNAAKLATTATGVDVTGILGVGATSPGTINSVAFSSVGLHTNSGTLGRTITEGSNSAEFIMNDSGASANERAKFIKSDSGVLSLGKFADNGTATNHLSISNSGDATFSGTLTVGADDTGHDVIFYGATSGAYLQWDESQDRLELRDNVQVAWGNGIDLTIVHDGTDSAITNSTGDLYIRNYADDKDVIFKASTGTDAAAEYFRLDGSSSGITVSAPQGMVFFDNVKAKFGNSDDLQIYHDGSHSYIKDGGAGSLKILTSQLAVSNAAGTEALLNATQDGAVNLYYNGVGPKLATASDGVTVTGDVSITSTAASAVGGGFDGAETATIQIGEVNQEIITTIQIDLGTGGATDIVSSSTAGDVIGENDTAAAFITKYDSTKNGVLYKAELICLETPAGGDTDINLVLNATSLAEDAAGETEGHVIVDGGAQTIGMRTESTASVVTAAAGAHNDYIYLTHGGTTAGTYSAGKFLIRLYGALATL
jgi:hypothetical protein